MPRPTGRLLERWARWAGRALAVGTASAELVVDDSIQICEPLPSNDEYVVGMAADGPTAGQRSRVALENAAGSGVDILVDQIRVWMSTSSNVIFYYEDGTFSTAGGTLPRRAYREIVGSEPGRVQADSAAVSPSGTLLFWENVDNAVGPFTSVIQLPRGSGDADPGPLAVVEPGHYLLGRTGGVNEGLSVCYFGRVRRRTKGS